MAVRNPLSRATPKPGNHADDGTDHAAAQSNAPVTKTIFNALQHSAFDVDPFCNARPAHGEINDLRDSEQSYANRNQRDSLPQVGLSESIARDSSLMLHSDHGKCHTQSTRCDPSH